MLVIKIQVCCGNISIYVIIVKAIVSVISQSIVSETMLI